MANTDIRTHAKTNKVALWEVADALKVSEATITRKLRREMTDNEKTKIMGIINRIAREKNTAAAEE